MRDTHSVVNCTEWEEREDGEDEGTESDLNMDSRIAHASTSLPGTQAQVCTALVRIREEQGQVGAMSVPCQSDSTGFLHRDFQGLERIHAIGLGISTFLPFPNFIGLIPKRPTFTPAAGPCVSGQNEITRLGWLTIGLVSPSASISSNIWRLHVGCDCVPKHVCERVLRVMQETAGSQQTLGIARAHYAK
ncbi:hypothetical protein P153DRAFT_380437 [Dothidotthia symphoricarpi CBS 119687]|uniref:Uncharacterized protein n=1 Tax=Dothidotthia symphoricarpi CBS 119687 TaxID=1392245 RepID=A0A6A6AUI2_9PLEO|nr:uncharacterized protein P153DRAFT_380437 [Dothidotthia symphoricarpi CBS 119687]KAF2134625.1 hypothetical protein P153DRAFT_380437 [Dothidotthia symphoricarpi CBS 119687]